ncbi:hypothetical protein Q1695_000880 [Nippostrongylus brasiliensis]|nr:hypothetical protein Q1695_000880 [Nippostrongylus brasiliensis]
MNLSWANHFAKTALKTAQQKIDSVLDIRPEEGETSVTIEDVITDDLLANPIVPLGAAEELSVPAPSSTSSGNGESWSNAWSSVTADQELIVDSEPNPIRDEAPHPPASLFDHSPSSNSSDGVEPGQSPQKVGDYEETKRDETVINEKSAYVDVDLSVPTDDTQFVSSSDTIQEESVLRPLPAIVRQNSHQDDSVTVASSDIEVIRNADAWSIASSKPATDHIPSHVLTTKHDSTESFRTQLLHAEQRRNELKAANDTLQSNNVQLQQRIIVLNQQHSSLKKELEDKKTELEDLLAEGKRLSDHSGKQAREIRRLKRMVKQLELNAERLLKEQSMREASTEVAQKQAQEQNRLVAELEEELADSRKQIEELIDNNKKLTREAELMQSANWSERLAGERANETVATMSAELSEARAHVERLKSQLQSTENRLDVVLNERNSVAECISQANIPLLDEISNLKQALHREQRASEESDIKTRSLTRELAVVKEQSEKLKGINDSLISQHHQELTVVNQKVQHLEHELAQVYKERERVASEYKLARVADAAALEDLRESNDALSNELSELRSVVKEIREENETLKTSLEEACAERREPPRPVEKVPQKQPQKESDFVDSNPFGDLVSPAPSVAPFSFASHQSTPNIHHDMSLKRITFLEQEAVRCFQLEDQVRQLKKELQTLNAQYNGLLVVDGERLERIEELENDVIDLRQLLKEQLLAFAEARIAESSEKP